MGVCCFQPKFPKLDLLDISRGSQEFSEKLFLILGFLLTISILQKEKKLFPWNITLEFCYYLKRIKLQFFKPVFLHIGTTDIFWRPLVAICSPLRRNLVFLTFEDVVSSVCLRTPCPGLAFPYSFSFLMTLGSKILSALSLIHIWRCRRVWGCRSRWSPYH